MENKYISSNFFNIERSSLCVELAISYSNDGCRQMHKLRMEFSVLEAVFYLRINIEF